MHLEIKTEAEAHELVYMLFMRKFYSHDTLAQMSTIVNDCILEVVAAAPQISAGFESHRARAADAFDQACRLPADGGRGLWEFLEGLESDDARQRAISEFFAPILPLAEHGFSSAKEVSDAYRT